MTTRLQGRVNRLRRIAMLAVALVPVVGFTSAANADDGQRGGWKNVRITIEASAADSRLVDTSCNGADPTRCMYLVSFTATQFGDLEGQIIEGDAITPLPKGGAVFADSGTFVGTVKGCGTGSFVYTALQIFGADGSQKDLYTIFPGAGTGDLEGMTGSFAANNLPGKPEPLAGVVRCRRR